MSRLQTIQAGGVQNKNLLHSRSKTQQIANLDLLGVSPEQNSKNIYRKLDLMAKHHKNSCSQCKSEAAGMFFHPNTVTILSETNNSNPNPPHQNPNPKNKKKLSIPFMTAKSPRTPTSKSQFQNQIERHPHPHSAIKALNQQRTKPHPHQRRKQNKLLDMKKWI